MKWQIRRRTPSQRSEREFRQTTLRMPLWRRIDIVLITGLVTALLLLTGAWITIITVGDRLGWFDAPAVQPLADARKAENANVRDSLSDDAVLDAIVHLPEDNLYISQEGGTIHRYNPRTRLWAVENLNRLNGEPIDTNFELLRSGCGADLYSNRTIECPDDDMLWALGSDGSLARRSGHWEVMVGNTAFAGARGKIVTDTLTVAAVSADQNQLVVGTRNDGLGIYDVAVHTWRSLDNEFYDQAPDTEITHLVEWNGFFWVGTPSGLARLSVSNNSASWRSGLVSTGKVLDLDGDPSGSLWILEERSCDESGEECLRVSKMDRARQGQPTIVLDQRNQYDLSLNTLQFAQLAGENLVLAGEAGVYVYNNDLHSWDQLSAESVVATLPLEDNSGLYFAFAGGIGFVEQGKLADEWEFANEPIQKLMFDGDDEILAFTNGNLFSISRRSGAYTKIYDAGSTAIDPTTFVSAANLDGTILFISPEGGLLHNTKTRSYDDINNLPAWMTRVDTRLLTVEDNVFIVSGITSQQATVYVGERTQMVDRNFYNSGLVDELAGIQVAGPIERVWKWGDEGIGLIDGDGQVRQFAPAISAETGPAYDLINNTTLQDVVQNDTEAIFLVDGRLERYDLTARTWDDMPMPSLNTDESIVELVNVAGKLLLVTSEQRLIEANGDPLIGDPNGGFEISDRALTDSWDTDAGMYLAGQGRVERYDSAARLIDRRWSIDSNVDVMIKAIENGVPIYQAGSLVAFGSDIVDEGGDRVVSASTDDSYIWTVRQAGANKYLKGHALNAVNNASRAVCLFRNPTAGRSVNTIYDAIELGDGTLAVATNAGLKFYSPKARSWYSAPSNVLSATRLYWLDAHLLLVRGDETNSSQQIAFIRLNADQSVDLPHSCDQATATVNSDSTRTVRAVAANTQSNRAAWVTADGTVTTWQSGQDTELLLSAGTSPTNSAFRHLYDYSSDGYLLFATSNSLWRYQLNKRHWSQIQISAPSNITDINIEGQGAERIIVAETDSQKFYETTFSITDASIILSEIYDGTKERFDAAAADVVDVQMRDGATSDWTVLLQDRIKYYDPESRRWRDSETFSSNTEPSFVSIQNRGVIVADGGATWHIARSTGVHPTDFARYRLTASDTDIAIDGTGQVQRLTVDGEIFTCSDDGSQYLCEEQRYQPFVLEPNQVRRAITWQDHIIFEFAEGLRAFEISSGLEKLLSVNAMELRDISAVHRFSSHLFLYSDLTDQVVVVDQQLNASRVTDVEKFVLDASARPWIFSAEWSQFSDSRFERVSDQVNLFVLGQSTVAGIDSTGIPIEWSGSQLVSDDLPLPADIQLDQVRALAKQPAGWWVLMANGDLFDVQRSTCFEPGPPLPTLTPIPTPVATISTTVTLTPTAMATPRPTLTPTPIACFEIARQANVSVDPVTFYDVDTTLTIVGSRGNVIVVSADATNSLATQSFTDSNLIPTLPDENEWGSLSQSVQQLPNGNQAYDPVVRFESNTSLNIVRQSGAVLRLEDSGALVTGGGAFRTADALDVGWFFWNRSADAFEVQTGSGRQRLTKETFIPNREFLFESADAILGNAPNDFQIANQYGIWAYPNSNLHLNDSVTFYPQSLSSAVYTAQGGFEIGSQRFEAGRNLATSSIADHVINVGDATFVENRRSVRGNVQIDGADINAFVANGFLWDTNRRGLAYDGNTLLLQSDAGVHPANSVLIEFDPAPNDLGRESGTLQTDGMGGVFLYQAQGDSWLQRNRTRWEAAINPHQNRGLIDNTLWTWGLQKNTLNIALKQDAFRFGFEENNFGFTFDVLRSAAAWEGSLYVATDAFLEVDDLPALQMVRTNRQPTHSTNRFQTIRFDDGRVELYSYATDALQRWETPQGAFQLFSGVDPEAERTLVDNERLFFKLANNDVTKEVYLDDLGTGGTWVPFEFGPQQQFPFDRVNSVTVGEALYIGTDAGLSVHDNGNTQWADLTNLYDMRPNNEASRPSSVSQVGFPESAPDLVMARNSTTCISSREDGMFAVCDDAAILNRRLRVQTRFWQWLTDERSTLIGQYVLTDQTVFSTTITVDEGRLPHDHVEDVIVCDGQALTLWNQTWVSAYDDTTIEIDSHTENYPMDDVPLQQLFCVEQPIALIGDVIDPGAYLLGSNSRVWRFANGRWITVQNEIIAAGVLDYAKNPPVLLEQAARLRIPAEGDAFVFEQRPVSGLWEPLEWHLDKIAQTWQISVDQWEQVILLEDQLWSATAEGILNVDRAGDAIVLNTDDLTIVREPAIEDELCLVTEMEPFDESVMVRCNYASSQVFEGHLVKQKDTDVFELSQTDPFVERHMMTHAETGYWDWQLIERVGGQLGRLAGQLHEEDVTLTGGVFDHDSLNSLALYQPDTLEIGTDTGGWYQSTRGSLPVASIVRPTIKVNDPILRVGVTIVDEAPLLCLQTGPQSFVRLAPDGTQEGTEKCPEFMGWDGLWRYSAENNQLSIVAPNSIGGKGERHLLNGRFSDDIVIGLPVMGVRNNEIFYWLPTRAGVLGVDNAWKSIELHTGPFTGLDGGNVPKALIMSSIEQPSYVGDQNLHNLGETREQLVSLQLPVSGSAVEQILAGYDDMLRLRWTSNDAQSGWTSIMPNQSSATNTYAVNVGQFERYIEREVSWGSPSPRITLQVQSTALDFYFGNSVNPYRVALPADFALVDAILIDTRIFLIGKHHLLDIDLESVMNKSILGP